ncbi:MAG: N-acetyltransferase [Spirochaetaceae bacterium]|nr:MAG: N-acetyltransferase [Spirochaetaceae bacterium]
MRLEHGPVKISEEAANALCIKNLCDEARVRCLGEDLIEQVLAFLCGAALENTEPVLDGLAGVVYEDWNDTGKIEWIGLIPELRGRSIGTDMLNQMIEWTRANGGRKIYVDTGNDAVLLSRRVTG